MLKRMRRIGLFVLAIAVVISSAIIASANERSGTNSTSDVETTSDYAVINNCENDVVVTIEHINKSTNEKIYTTDSKTLSSGGIINDYRKALNWDVSEVWVDNQKITNNNYKIIVSKNTTIKVFYEQKTSDTTGDVTFYDYTIKSGYYYQDMWNNKVYDNFNRYGDQPNEQNQKLTAGTYDNNWDNYGSQYHYHVYNDKEQDANANNQSAFKGLLKEVANGGDGDVKFNYPEPGFFVDSDLKDYANDLYLRKVYKDFKLGFTRTGDTYKFENVKDGDNVLTTSGKDFFPLDKKYKNTYEGEQNSHNYFFGMRYDIKFKIGDYIGQLNYKFKGDDDLWVVLDGKKIVLDIGGIHPAIEETADLWDYILEDGQSKEDLTLEQKQQTHTLTILYMERGAGESNCEMNFTIPEAQVINVKNNPLANLSLLKTDTDGKGLSGATFSLKNDTTEEVFTGTSDNEGKLNINYLKEGTYTLTETSAPNGYIVSTEQWKVEVSSSDGVNATIKMTKSDGTEVSLTNGYYQITNQTKSDFIKNSINVNKTAKVKDWDKRTYDIHLTASAKGSTTTTITKKVKADIVLVLDVSGSMDNEVIEYEYSYVADNTDSGRRKLNTNTTYYVKDNDQYLEMKYNNRYRNWYINNKPASQNYVGEKIYSKTVKSKTTRLAALKQSVNQFINDTAASSPDSKIGITAFSSTHTSNKDNGKHTDGLLEVSNNKTSLIDFTNNLRSGGGTKPEIGLKNAKDMLDSLNDDRPKYVVLFTDGAPTGDNTSYGGNAIAWDGTTVNNANNAAKSLKDAGYTVYTIGFALDDRAKTFLAGGTYSGTTYPGIATNANYAKEASDATSLNDIFKEIQSSITNYLEISNATVTDVIDNRFILLKDDGTPITNDMLADGKTITLNNGGVVSLDSKGNQVITWTNQTISNEEKGGWSKDIVVKAKDEYIGGNDVTTNGANSGVTVDDTTVSFPQPVVNVKSELFITNKEITIYKSDSIPSDDEILTAVAGKYIGHHGVKKEDFIIEKFTNSELTDTNVTNTPESDTEYYIKVTYKNLGKPSDESTSNTDGNVSGVESNENYEVVAKNDGVIHTGDKTKNDDSLKDKEYGKYIVHVKSGKLTIVKTLEDDKKVTKDTTFKFRVTGPNNYSKDIDVVIKAGENQSTSEELTGLARGEYTITELEIADYEQKSVKFIKDATDSLNKIDGMNGKITFGTNDNNQNVIKDYQYLGNGVKGKIEFTNNPVITNWKIVKVRKDDNKTIISGAKFALKQNGKVKYTGESDENGYIIWSKGSENNAMLASGEYILEETEAAEGYAKGDTTWTLKVTDGGNLEYIKDADGKVISPSVVEEVNLYKFTNDVPYELPETGGIGIYWYTVGGMLLMVMAAIVVYRKRYNEYMNK